jgi:hypothetical protein
VKAQSREGELNLELLMLLKGLGLLYNDWAPAALHLTFELEADKELLLKKSEAAAECSLWLTTRDFPHGGDDHDEKLALCV